MKKSLFAVAFAALSLSMSAQRASDAAFSADDLKDYNRIGISYNNEKYGECKDLEVDDLGLNGVGVDYIHGFHVTESLPLFIETGLNFNCNFNTKTLYEFDYTKETLNTRDINLQVPVNVAWRFNVAENLSIAPYVGLNFKLHLATSFKYKLEKYEDVDESKYNAFDKDDMDGDTFNRFQMGWHVGVGFQYNPIYLGVQYGTDFIKAYSHGVDKVNTQNLKIVLAYTF